MYAALIYETVVEIEDGCFKSDILPVQSDIVKKVLGECWPSCDDSDISYFRRILLAIAIKCSVLSTDCLKLLLHSVFLTKYLCSG
jgi:hypothetical protein